MARRRFLLAMLALLAPALGPALGWACFGAELRVGVGGDATDLAAYATGYYIEEKTGIAPDFRETTDDPATALKEGEIDLYLAPADDELPEGMISRPLGELPDAGERVYWLRATILEDLRFTTVNKALGRIPAFFGSSSFENATKSDDAPKKAARKAVLDAE